MSYLFIYLYYFDPLFVAMESTAVSRCNHHLGYVRRLSAHSTNTLGYHYLLMIPSILQESCANRDAREYIYIYIRRPSNLKIWSFPPWDLQVRNLKMTGQRRGIERVLSISTNNAWNVKNLRVRNPANLYIL